jgi:hypothetical protein
MLDAIAIVNLKGNANIMACRNASCKAKDTKMNMAGLVGGCLFGHGGRPKAAICCGLGHVVG